ncbi:hypothetical protein CC78DRAFT_573675 [Lojkania enalia]|uniref:Uncharacterized protein n=1 Tax=Lojkania enalia TaxID=147567 RepID=A0A9P4TQX0_9PLEO|nr:hypothetical protein CC78DRAFT_573675 [Didymosphaeria enalia]
MPLALPGVTYHHQFDHIDSETWKLGLRTTMLDRNLQAILGLARQMEFSHSQTTSITRPTPEEFTRSNEQTRYEWINSALIENARIQATEEGFLDKQESLHAFQLILKGQKCWDWLHLNNSGIIVMCRGFKDLDSAPIFRFFAATLAESLARSTPAIVLHFTRLIGDASLPRGSFFLLVQAIAIESHLSALALLAWIWADGIYIHLWIWASRK